MAHREIDLDALSPEEQLELLDRPWERLGRSPDLFPLTEPWRRIPSPFLWCIATSVERCSGDSRTA
jgi:hypothetical protein